MVQKSLQGMGGGYVVIVIATRWLYCVECPQYTTRLEALGYLCDCVSGRVQR